MIRPETLAINGSTSTHVWIFVVTYFPHFIGKIFTKSPLWAICEYFRSIFYPLLLSIFLFLIKSRSHFSPRQHCYPQIFFRLQSGAFSPSMSTTNHKLDFFLSFHFHLADWFSELRNRFFKLMNPKVVSKQCCWGFHFTKIKFLTFLVKVLRLPVHHWKLPYKYERQF